MGKLPKHAREPPLAVAYRFMDSPAQLAAYTRRKEGPLWRDPETFNTPVYYLSFHGSPGKSTPRSPKSALRRFYADPDPWRNLRQIHDSVLEDFAPARALGHVLHIRGR
jgi:hypothetical protein